MNQHDVFRLVGGCFLALRDGTSVQLPENVPPAVLEASGLAAMYGALCARFGLNADSECIAAGMMLRATNEKRWSGLQQILGSLREVGINPVVFKGGALVARWPGLLATRPMDDFDLLVPQAQLRSLRRFLIGDGFREDNEHTPISHWLSKGALVWRGEGIAHQNLDIHSRVTESPACRSLTRSMLDTDQSAEGVRVPDIEDSICMIALHVVRSGMARPLKEYIDLLWYIHGMDDAQWRSTVACAKRHSLDPALYIVLRQAIHCSAMPDLDPQLALVLRDRLDKLESRLSRWRRAGIDRLAPADRPLSPNLRFKHPLLRRSVVMFVGISSPWRVTAAFFSYGLSRLADRVIPQLRRSS